VAVTSNFPGTQGELGQELIAALELAREAGALVMKYRGGELDIEIKSDDSPVTVADKADGLIEPAAK
jgi:3'-phosphoadenosine 5'-phosphosulfate (PAPS) 3'-phosphatase